MNSMSKQRVKVIVNGKPFLVEIDDLSASPLMVKVNGQPYVVDIETDAVKKTGAAEAETAFDTPPPPATPAPSTTPQPSHPARTSSMQEVKVPMPGYIIDIAVKPGDEVSAGQTLCLLEAMKMKNAIQSPYDGVIASVGVVVGQSVTYGDVLVTFE